MPPNRGRARHRPLTLATAAGITSLILPTVTIARLFSVGHLSAYSLIYACAVNGITFLSYGYDKMQARNMEWRVKETTLHLLAVAGGWPGALAGMHYFQHKTRKMTFQMVFWGIVLVWEGLAVAIWTNGFQAT
jgi:uncharacterized membrane protein YsdA (DUF1294 family)